MVCLCDPGFIAQGRPGAAGISHQLAGFDIACGVYQRSSRPYVPIKRNTRMIDETKVSGLSHLTNNEQEVD